MGLPSIVPSAETAKSEAERKEREALEEMFSPSSPRDEQLLGTAQTRRSSSDMMQPDSSPHDIPGHAAGGKISDDKGVIYFISFEISIF